LENFGLGAGPNSTLTCGKKYRDISYDTEERKFRDDVRRKFLTMTKKTNRRAILQAGVVVIAGLLSGC